MAIQSRILSSGKPKKNQIHRIILVSLTILMIVAVVIALNLFRNILKPNVRTENNAPVSVIIPAGSNFNDVREILYKKGLIIDHRSFEWVAERKNYPNLVKPGHYIIKASMDNNDLVNMLRSGEQAPVKVVFNNIRLKSDLAGNISRQIEADSVSLMKCWNDREFLKTLNTTPDKILMIFIPNTYEFWWTTDAYDFTRRMYKEFKNFWEGERTQKAGYTRLSISEIIILASIIEKETQKNDEKPSIAGVYLNRLRKGWPLQADPTVVFATGDYDMKRVLTIHTKIDSPYNTYKYAGLPPGPICIPSIASIDAVLNYRKHDYMFFCAKDDLSGYHAFARTLAEHNRYARAYQKALNERRII
jgi:UPF0755 protein